MAEPVLHIEYVESIGEHQTRRRMPQLTHVDTAAVQPRFLNGPRKHTPKVRTKRRVARAQAHRCAAAFAADQSVISCRWARRCDAYEWAVTEMRRREIEVWILDPFSGAYAGDENDNSQINAFTKRLDELKRAAGIVDLFMPAHTGRQVEPGAERARGGAKLDDWTDNRWVLSRVAQGDRYFKAEGRRVQMEERELAYDRLTNSLRYSTFGGSRAQKTSSSLRQAVLDYVAANPGRGVNDIMASVGGKADHVRSVLRRLVDEHDLEVRSGPRNSRLHYMPGSAPVSAM